MVKVRTGRAAFLCISATTMDESTPPDKKAPSGTSDIMRASTARASESRSSSFASALSVNGRSRAASAASTADQNGRGSPTLNAPLTMSTSTVSIVLAGSLRAAA